MLDVATRAGGGPPQARLFRRQQLLDDPAPNATERAPGDATHGADVSLELLRRIVGLAAAGLAGTQKQLRVRQQLLPARLAAARKRGT